MLTGRCLGESEYGSRRGWNAFVRTISIIWILAKCFIVCTTIRLCFLLLPRNRDPLAAIGKEIVTAALRLGPVGIKISQLASARGDILPRQIADELSILREKVPSPTLSEVRQHFRELFPNEPGIYLTSVDWESFASGSIAYVLRATLRSGAPVAIKIVRPGVRDAVLLDVQVMSALLRPITAISKDLKLVFDALFGNLSLSLLDQCDMSVDANNLKTFTVHCSPFIRLPRVITTLSNKSALTMEFVEGKSITDCEDDQVYKELVVSLLKEVFRMVFVHGIMHTDLHPGNVRMTPDGQLALLDFGLLGTLSLQGRKRFRKFFFGLVTADSALVAKVLIDTAGKHFADEDVRAFELEIDNLLVSFSFRVAGEFMVAGLIRKLVELQRKWKLVADPGFSNAAWVLTVLEGLIRGRIPTLKFQTIAIEYLMMPYENIHAA